VDLSIQTRRLSVFHATMSYKLAIFDFDGTLADSFAWFMDASNEAADRYGFRRIEDADREMLRGQEARQIIRHLGMPLWKLPLVARFMRRRMAMDVASIPLYAGVDALLRRLSRQRVRLAIVSSNSEENIRRILGPGLAPLIQHYECGTPLFGKRSRLRKVLRAAGVRPADALCIGDEIRDLRAAHAEGIPFGAVSWGYTRPDALLAHAPAELFSHVDEILAKVA
jgi:phosphoglycolate phosphatase